MKVRLDKLLLQKNLAPTRQKAQALIAAGQVLVNNNLADKAGTKVEDSATIVVKESCPYVSRGGYKLEEGLNFFVSIPCIILSIFSLFIPIFIIASFVFSPSEVIRSALFNVNGTAYFITLDSFG